MDSLIAEPLTTTALYELVKAFDGHQPQDLSSHEKALTFLSSRLHELCDQKSRQVFREGLRIHLLSEQLTTGKKLDISGEFDGYSDSGNTSINTGSSLADAFLEYMIEEHVTFDWYNNEGGGGDITWNLDTDKVIINGYQNVVVKESQMTEAEF